MIAGSGENTYRLQAERLRGELAYKRRFTAIVAHEMRNFLAPAAYEVELLARADSAKAIHVRQAIARQLAQMKRLVNDLLDISSAEEGRLSLYREAIDLREVIKAAVEVAQPIVLERQHCLTMPSGPSEAVVIYGDRCRLTQVVSNLLINAAKFTPKGGEIRISLGHAAHCVTIGVRDTGIGIGPDMLSRIFDIYQRAPQEDSEACGGLGLGLAIARHLVEAHGGTLNAYSAGPGQGSEFVVRLPVPTTPDDGI